MNFPEHITEESEQDSWHLLNRGNRHQSLVTLTLKELDVSELLHMPSTTDNERRCENLFTIGASSCSTW